MKKLLIIFCLILAGCSSASRKIASTGSLHIPSYQFKVTTEGGGAIPRVNTIGKATQSCNRSPDGDGRTLTGYCGIPILIDYDSQLDLYISRPLDIESAEKPIVNIAFAFNSEQDFQDQAGVVYHSDDEVRQNYKKGYLIQYGSKSFIHSFASGTILESDLPKNSKPIHIMLPKLEKIRATYAQIQPPGRNYSVTVLTSVNGEKFLFKNSDPMSESYFESGFSNDAAVIWWPKGLDPVMDLNDNSTRKSRPMLDFYGRRERPDADLDYTVQFPVFNALSVAIPKNR